MTHVHRAPRGRHSEPGTTRSGTFRPAGDVHGYRYIYAVEEMRPARSRACAER